MGDVRKFADKWIEKFKTSGCYEIIEDQKFAEECWELGFEIDMGEKLQEDFPSDATIDVAWMEKHANEIDDAVALGNSIFSRWRCFSDHASGLDNHDYRKWFICALSRLKELAE